MVRFRFFSNIWPKQKSGEKLKKSPETCWQILLHRSQLLWVARRTGLLQYISTWHAEGVRMAALHTQVIVHYAARNDRGVRIVGENRVHVVVRVGQREGIESEE